MKKILIFATLLFFVCAAEILEEKEFPHHKRPDRHHKPHGWHKDIEENEKAMEQLKKEDPDFYEKIMKLKEERRAKRKDHFEELREKDPEKYEEILKRKEEHHKRWEEHKKRWDHRKLDEEENDQMAMRRHFAHKAKSARQDKGKKHLRFIDDVPTEQIDQESMPRPVRDRPPRERPQRPERPHVDIPRQERPRYDLPRHQRDPVVAQRPSTRPHRPEN